MAEYETTRSGQAPGPSQRRWPVVVTGRAARLTNPELIEHYRNVPLVPWHRANALRVEHDDAVLALLSPGNNERGAEAASRSATASTRARRSDGSVPGRLPAFTSRCRQFLTALGLGAPQTELLHLPRSATSAKVPPRRDVSPYLVSPVLRRQEGWSPRFAGGAAAGEFHIRQSPVDRTLRMPGIALSVTASRTGQLPCQPVRPGPGLAGCLCQAGA